MLSPLNILQMACDKCSTEVHLNHLWLCVNNNIHSVSLVCMSAMSPVASWFCTYVYSSYANNICIFVMEFM